MSLALIFRQFRFLIGAVNILGKEAQKTHHGVY